MSHAFAYGGASTRPQHLAYPYGAPVSAPAPASAPAAAAYSAAGYGTAAPTAAYGAAPASAFAAAPTYRYPAYAPAPSAAYAAPPAAAAAAHAPTVAPAAAAPVAAAVPAAAAAAAPAGAAALPQPAARPQINVPDVIEDKTLVRLGCNIKRYKTGQCIGKGGFARCYHLTSFDTARVYAGKIIPKASIQSSSARKKLQNEIRIHRSVTHPNVVRFERYFEDTENIIFLLELCTQQTLMELVKRRGRLTETEAQTFLFQIVNAVHALHQSCVIHRDLKLGNIFLSGALDVKIGDFGLATRLEHPEERKKTICGTPNYIAPEVISDTAGVGHSFEVDTWAIGVIAFTLLFGRPPFETSSVKATYQRIKDNDYTFPEATFVSAAAKAFISSILHPDPAQRPTLSELREHPFFTQSPFPARLPPSSLQTALPYTHRLHPGGALYDVALARARVSGSGPLLGSGLAPAAADAAAAAAGEVLPFVPVDVATAIREAPAAAVVPKPAPGAAPIVAASGAASASIPAAAAATGSLPTPAAAAAAPTDADAENARPAASASSATKPAAAAAAAAAAAPAVSAAQGRLTRSRAAPLSAVPSSVTNVPAPLPAPSAGSQKMTYPSATPTQIAAAAAAAAATAAAAPVTRAAASAASADVLTTRTSTRAFSTAAGPQVSALAAAPAAPAPASAPAPAPAAVPAAHAAAPLAQPLSQQEDPAVARLASGLAAMQLNSPGPAATTPAAAALPTAASHAAVPPHFTVPALLPAPALAPSPLPSPAPAAAPAPTAAAAPAPTVAPAAAEPGAGALQAPSLWVNLWVDYSNKYGLGYLLSDGSCGVHFNDYTKIIMHPDGRNVQYIAKKSSTAAASDAPGSPAAGSSSSGGFSVQSFDIDAFPLDLTKKVTLLKHFLKYLIQQNRNDAPQPGSPDWRAHATPFTRDAVLPHVRSWCRTEHAMVFRLSARISQFIFFDETELVLSTEDCVVAYTDKNKERNVYAFADVFVVPRPDLHKRMKYAKQTMTAAPRSNAPAA